MTGVLAAIGVLLLGIIAFRLTQLARMQHALLRALMPHESPPLEAMPGENGRARSVVDQLGDVAVDTNRRLVEIEKALRYLRSYVWEERDQRFYEDVLQPPKSAYWNRSFGPRGESGAEYGLWRRERDLDERWHKDVVIPSLAEQKSSDGSDEPPASGAAT